MSAPTTRPDNMKQATRIGYGKIETAPRNLSMYNTSDNVNDGNYGNFTSATGNSNYGSSDNGNGGTGYSSSRPSGYPSGSMRPNTNSSGPSSNSLISKYTGPIKNVGERMTEKMQGSLSQDVKQSQNDSYGKYHDLEHSIRDFKSGKDNVAENLRNEIELLRSSLIAIHETIEKQDLTTNEQTTGKGLISEWIARGDAPSLKKIQSQRIELGESSPPQVILLAQTQRYMETLCSQISQLRKEQDRRDILISRLQDSLFSILDSVGKKPIAAPGSHNHKPWSETASGPEQRTSGRLMQKNPDSIDSNTSGPMAMANNSYLRYGMGRTDSLVHRTSDIALPHEQLFSLKR